jgi:hypothetical protein
MYINLLLCATAALVNTPFRAKSFVFVLYPIVLLSFIWRQQARVLMFLSLVAGNDNDSMYDESIRYLLGRLFLHA